MDAAWCTAANELRHVSLIQGPMVHKGAEHALNEYLHGVEERNLV
jgi:hypothetical protein